MKIPFGHIFLSLALLSGMRLSAQDATPVLPVDPDTKFITYQEVVSIAGTPAELFNRTIEWVNKQYKNPTVATKVRNPATGIIEIAHRIELAKVTDGVSLPAGIVDYTLKIELKEGRYRYTITNFNLKNVSPQPIESWLDKKDNAYTPARQAFLKQIDDTVRKLIESLKQGLQPPAAKKMDVW